MQGYHPDPTDYQRYTIDGIRKLFAKFDILQVVNTRGSGSTVAGLLREFFAILFSFNCIFLYKALRVIWGWVFFPLKYLDFVLVHNQMDHVITSGFTLIARTRKEAG